MAAVTCLGQWAVLVQGDSEMLLNLSSMSFMARDGGKLTAVFSGVSFSPSNVSAREALTIMDGLKQCALQAKR